jgi:hypothetical protein
LLAEMRRQLLECGALGELFDAFGERDGDRGPLLFNPCPRLFRQGLPGTPGKRVRPLHQRFQAGKGVAGR